jgi:uncharacterized protein (TIGR03032 family)
MALTKQSKANKRARDFWSIHTREWRDQSQITSQWKEAGALDKEILSYKVSNDWWRLIHKLGITLLVTREYEHLVMALSTEKTKPNISYQPLPHPSGLVVDRKANKVYIASTRNPNQVFIFEPITGQLIRRDSLALDNTNPILVPIASRFYPGCMYFHDLSLIGGQLYANAVGHNAIVRLKSDGGYKRVWWPKFLKRPFDLNVLQLNSIAAGKNINRSFFSASTARILKFKPGHEKFDAKEEGVVFSAKTGKPILQGLTRPHSARLHKGKLWLDNSGFGEFGFESNGKFFPIVKLPGWTRGLCFVDDIAFVGTSQIISKFRHYAPGLKESESVCGVHAVHMKTGKVLGSLVWPYGNQIFAIDWIPRKVTTGFAFKMGGHAQVEFEKKLFYSFKTKSIQPGE